MFVGHLMGLRVSPKNTWVYDNFHSFLQSCPGCYLLKLPTDGAKYVGIQDSRESQGFTLGFLKSCTRFGGESKKSLFPAQSGPVLFVMTKKAQHTSSVTLMTREFCRIILF